MKVNYKVSKDDRIFTILNYTFITVFFLLVMYPLIYIVSSSFSDPDAVMAGKVWLLPINPTLEGYRAVFKHKLILSGFANSVFYTIIGTMIQIVMTILAAYPLSRRHYPFKTLLMWMFLFTMFFSGGLIPSYLLIKDLGWLDSRLSLVVPGAISVWNMIIARTYFENSIPHELLEAAQIDGCSDIRFLRTIVLPLSKPIIAVLVLYYAIYAWNSYFSALLFLSDRGKFPLQLVLRDILIENNLGAENFEDIDMSAVKSRLQALLKYSMIVISSIPLLIAYPFVQKHFVKGVMIGSVKG